jgi:hypothetical protein
MTHRIRHPFDDILYELTDEGLIRLTDGDRQGLFRQDGRWIEGDIRQCDPQMCVWVGNRPDESQVESDSHISRRHTIDPQ